MKRHWLAGLAAILAVAMGLHLYSQNAGLPKPEFAESRSKLLGTIPLTRPGAFEFTPNADGDYVYEATSAKLMVEGCEGVNLAMDPDTGVKGLATVVAGRQEVRYGGMPRLNGVCWRLKGIKPGQYWVGLLIKIGAFGNGIECALPTIRPADIFLNGRQVPCSTLSDPIQVAPGVWFAEAQAAGDTALREGDEISVVGDHVMATAPVARLILHAKEPYRGAFKTCANPGPTNLNQNTSLGIAADIGFVAARKTRRQTAS